MNVTNTTSTLQALLRQLEGNVRAAHKRLKQLTLR